MNYWHRNAKYANWQEKYPVYEITKTANTKSNSPYLVLLQAQTYIKIQILV